jgi:hypothetical protein
MSTWMALWCFGLALPRTALAQAARHDRRPSSSDSTATPGSLLEKLQARDKGLYDDELLQGNAVFRDSSVARFDSLGLAAWTSEVDQRRKRWRFDFDPAFRLWTYQRVEGLVAAGGASIETTGGNHLRLEGQGGYATGSKHWRSYTSAELVFDGSDSYHRLRAYYADRVVPFGSNRPVANGLIALTAGVDEQDYLHRQGGAAEWWSSLGSHVGLGVGYGEHRESSVPQTTEFAFFGKMDEPNPMVSNGVDRALHARARLIFFRRRMQVNVLHRVAGGGLGGDFTYNRTQVDLAWRFYAWRRHELATKLTGVQNGGTPSFQQLGDVGGISTVRGYERRFLVGENMVAGRVEWLFPYDVLRATDIPGVRSLGLQFVPWGDAGRVWNGNSNEWIQSAGLGIQRFLGMLGPVSNLRMDFAFPIGPDRPDDFRIHVQFTSAEL